MNCLMTILRRWRLAWGGALLLASAGVGAQHLPGLPGGGGLPGGVPTAPSLPSGPSLP